jgi:glycosyltransferase involved in cell wall biosynthesis
MRILHLSTGDQEGAYGAAYRVHTALRRRGQDSTMLVVHRGRDDATISRFLPSKDLLSRVRRRIRRARIARDFSRYRSTRPGGLERFSDDRSPFAAEFGKPLPRCDVVNLHWVADFLDYQSFFKSVPRRTPVVWRLADMNAFTGGCHYDAGCARFLGNCGQCPQLGSSDPSDLSHMIWERKRVAFESVDPTRLHIVATSRWLAEQAKKSSLLGRFPVSTIPNMIDTTDFAPRDRAFARQVLGLQADARVVLFVSQAATNRRKGLALLAQAVETSPSIDNLVLLSVGSGKPVLSSRVHNVHLGHVSNERFLSLIYSAADLFVIPSLQEAFGQTVLEAMACGVPVVGFEVGGIPDMVRSGRTGVLVPVGDAGALRDAIAELLNAPAARERMAVECRRVAVAEYSFDVLADKYLALYQGMLNGAPPARLSANIGAGG